MTASQKITLTQPTGIPFNKLILSQANVRRVKTGVSIDELAEDISHRGLLQSLSVRPEKPVRHCFTGSASRRRQSSAARLGRYIRFIGSARGLQCTRHATAMRRANATGRTGAGLSGARCSILNLAGHLRQKSQ